MSARAGLPRLLTGERRGLFACLVANGLAQAALLVAMALLTRACFDGLEAAGREPGATTAAAGGLIASGGLLLWLRTAERTTAERLGQSFLTATRLRLFDHLNAVPSRILQRRTRGVLMVRFVADLNALHNWVSRGIARLLVATTTTVAVLAVLSWLNPTVALTVALVLLAAAAVAAATGPALYDRVRVMRRARGRLAANLGEKLTAGSPMHVFGRTGGERSRLADQSRRYAEAAVARARLAALLRALPDALLPAVTALTVLVGLAVAEPMTPGALLGTILVVNLLASPLRDLAQIFVFRQTFRAARDVLADFLALPTLQPPGLELPRLAPGPGRLTFESVRVEGSLRGVDVEAGPRSLVAVTGASGSGKSTLLALAARLFDPDDGVVRIDRQALPDRDLTSVRQAIGMVSPDLPLQRGSVRRTLTYRARSATDDDIAEVLRLCGLEAELAQLPRGLDTRLVEGGLNLPAGMRQRLLLARAIMGRPRVLLIDEADALGLDGSAGQSLARILARRVATTLIVTANPRWLRLADAVWRLEEGGLRTDARRTEPDQATAALPCRAS